MVSLARICVGAIKFNPSGATRLLVCFREPVDFSFWENLEALDRLREKMVTEMSVAVDKSEMFLEFCRIPLIDMHDFSQDEINLAAQNSDELRADDVVVPKIDPSIFQESGGNRKQTYSRLQLSQKREEAESVSRRRAGLHAVSRRRNIFNESEQQEARRILELIQELLNNGDNVCKSSSVLNVPPLNRTCNVEDLYTDHKKTSPIGSNCLQLVVEDCTLQNEDDANLTASTPDIEGTMAINNIGTDNGGIDRAKKKIRTKEGARRKPFMNAVEAADEQMFLKVAGSNAENTASLAHNDDKAPGNMEENATCNDDKAEDCGVHVDNVTNSTALPSVAKEPFVPQLKRKFTPLATEAELQEFFNNIGGEWASKMKKRKIVDAEDFGEGFPKGWKLLLGVRKKYGRFIIECRKYISPEGLQFASCREVSAYFLSNSHLSATEEVAAPETPCHTDSDNGHQIVLAGTPKENTVGVDQLMNQDGGDTILTGLSNMGKDTEQQSMEFSSAVPGTGKQKTWEGDRSLEAVDIVGKTKKRNNLNSQNTPMNCKKCNVIFSNRSTFMAHLTIHHVKKEKILDDKVIENGANMNNGKSIHQVKKKKKVADKAIEYSAIMKNGKYECQICHKAFSERNRYTGHIGVHARKNTKKPQVPLEQTGTEAKGDFDDKETSDVNPEVHVKMEDTSEILETNAPVAQEGVSNSFLELLGAASGEDSLAAPNIGGFLGSLDSDLGKDQAKFTTGNEKLDGISDFGKIQMYMPSPKFSFGTGQDANCAVDAPIELGLDGDELHQVEVPPEQFGWDPFLSERENNSSQCSVCIWCNTEFSHDGIDQDQQADSVGFICPVCKTKISGQAEMDSEHEKV